MIEDVRNLWTLTKPLWLLVFGGSVSAALYFIGTSNAQLAALSGFAGGASLWAFGD